MKEIERGREIGIGRGIGIDMGGIMNGIIGGGQIRGQIQKGDIGIHMGIINMSQLVAEKIDITTIDLVLEVQIDEMMKNGSKNKCNTR